MQQPTPVETDAPAQRGDTGYAPITVPARALGGEMLRYLADVVASQVQESGISPEQAAAIGETTAEQVRDKFGGQVLYVSKGSSLKARQRWGRIWAEFNGTNHAELASKYGMGVQGIYRVLAIMRAEFRRTSQPDLFNPQPEDKT